MNAAPWRIGLRWALQPARWRSGRFAVELVATTLAGIGMAAAVAFAAGIPDDGYSRHLLQQIIALLLLGAPGLLMATTVARLASGTRDRRYAALRLLGVSAASTRLFTILETAVPVLTGLVLAVALYQVGQSLLGGFELPPAGAAGVVLAAGLGALLTAALGSAGSSDMERSQSAGREPRAGSPWRVVPLVLALLGAGFLTLTSSQDGSTGITQVAAAVAGTALVGIWLAVPQIARWFAEPLTRLGPAGLLAGRSVQAAPAAAARATSVLAVALATMVLAMTFVASLLTTPTFARAQQADTTGPSYVIVFPGPEQSQEMQQLLGDPLVITSASRHSSACDPSDPDKCVFVYYGTCPELTTATLGAITDCPPGPAWITNSLDWSGTVALQIVDTAEPFTVELPDTDPVLEAAPGTLTPPDALYVPALPIAARPPVPEGGISVQIHPGRANAAAFQARAEDLGLPSTETSGFDNLDQAQSLRNAVTAGSAAIMFVAIAWLLLSSIDWAQDRAPLYRRFMAMGIPAGTVTRATALTTLIPALLGIALATGTGYVLAQFWINGYPDASREPATQAITTTLGITALAVVLLSVAAAASTRAAARAELRGDT